MGDILRSGLLRILLYVVCVAAIVILTQFFIELRRAEDDQTRAEFRARTAEFSQKVEHGVLTAINDTLSVGALFESTNDVSEIEFSRFIIRSEFFSGLASIRAIAAIPLLTREELPGFNAALKSREYARGQLGYAPFEIHETPGREIYAPATYVESLTGREGILGYDIASSPERMRTARTALLLAQPHMTPPIALSQDANKNITSVLIFAAVKSGGNMGLRPYKGAFEDRTTFIGTSYSPSVAIENITDPNPSGDLFNIHITDITDSVPISIYGSAQEPIENAITETYRLVFGGRVWSLNFTATPILNNNRDSNAFILLGAVGVFLILALTVALDQLIKGQGALETLVSERTSQLHSMNEMLQTSVAKASAESDAKSLFLAHMSHELRTPLNAVIGYAQMLKSQIYGDLGDQRYHEYAETIESAGNIQLQLVEDILALIALQGGTRELEHAQVDLDALAHNCVELVKQRSDEKKLVMQVVSKLGNEPFLGDERSIQQIIINLLSNAIKFTPPQGHITVRLSRDNLGMTSIAVEDTGVGIEAKYIDKVLQPFGQANVNPYNAHEGVGLGLSIVTGLTEASGGSIRIESEPDKGTTVIVEFPPSI